jgi:hypothetical protein
MKTQGILTVEDNGGANPVEVAIAPMGAPVGPTVDVFTFVKEAVRKAALDLPALVVLALTNAASGINRVFISEPADAAENTAGIDAVIAHVGAANVQRFELQPDAESGLVKQRGVWLPTAHSGAGAYVSNDLRRIVRSFALPSVERKYEAAVPNRENGGDPVTEETSERVYTALQLIAAIQRGIETDSRFSTKQWAFVIDERNKHIYFAMKAANDADPIADAIVNGGEIENWARCQIQVPAAEVNEPAAFELV